jgi:predicted nucleic acid-binding protein
MILKMLKVVSNTTSIISLLKIGKLEILKNLYGNIYISNGVFKEIEAGKNKVFYEDLSQVGWIFIQDINNKKAIDYFLDLDKGEAESIILDETLGRFHVKFAGLKLTGTLGVLLKAKQLAIIPMLKPLLLELKSKGIWLSDKLIEKVLKIANE